jgi:protein ImuA
MNGTKTEIINQLKKEILSLQGFKTFRGNDAAMIGPGIMQDSFPNHCFPSGALHEFVNTCNETAAASNGFMSGLLGQLMKGGGVCVWISTARNLFPPALKIFGVIPEQVIFIDVQKEKEVLWAMEEALKCEGLSAVVGEIQQIDFTASRRLQLSAEQSRVTGFVLRKETSRLNTIACVARWKVSPCTSNLPYGMPGVGFPKWKVELLKIRNGKPGTWDLEWRQNNFHPAREEQPVHVIREKTRKAG